MSESNDYFGVCPYCNKSDGYFNVGRSHWFFCRDHRVKWLFGANIFSSWRDETEAEQRQRYDAEGFGAYTNADDLHATKLDHIH